MPKNGPITPTPTRLAQMGIGFQKVTRRGFFGRVGRALGVMCLLPIAAEVVMLPTVESAPLPAALPVVGGYLVPDTISLAEFDGMIATLRETALALPPMVYRVSP